MRFTILLLPIALGLASCQSTPGQPRAVTAATPAQKAALIDRVKSLAGTWDCDDPQGGKSTCVYQVSSNGSAVREVMFPGTDHEMTNMYTMDGPDLLVTHYCAMGNQPHMKAKAGDANRIEFKCCGVSNLTSPDQTYMGGLTITFVDADHVRQDWRSIESGGPGKHMVTLEFVRRR